MKLKHFDILFRNASAGAGKYNFSLDRDEAIIA